MSVFRKSRYLLYKKCEFKSKKIGFALNCVKIGVCVITVWITYSYIVQCKSSKRKKPHRNLIKMKAEQVNRVCDEMNNETKEFLAKFSSKLDKLFSNEASDTYLTRMVEHLRTFYEDVFNELEDKRVSITQGIEGACLFFLHRKHK